VELDRTTDATEALEGTDIVHSAAEHGRFRYRRQDYEVPNCHGARQINGENGGPGAVFHTLRSVHNTLGICADIERHCPDAFLVNLSNPLSRVALAIDQHTKVRSVSMCHEMPNGIWRLSKFLRMDAKDIEGRASGINHFTFFTELRDRRTGELTIVEVLDAQPVLAVAGIGRSAASSLQRRGGPARGHAGLVDDLDVVAERRLQAFEDADRVVWVHCGRPAAHRRRDIRAGADHRHASQ
jgi:alpha-galactosidase